MLRLFFELIKLINKILFKIFFLFVLSRSSIFLSFYQMNINFLWGLLLTVVFLIEKEDTTIKFNNYNNNNNIPNNNIPNTVR